PPTVRAVTTVDVATLGPEASVHDAIELLVGQDLDTIPVVEGTSIVGLVTTRDLLAMLLDLLDSSHPTGFEHIVVAVDFDEGTAAAVATGLALAREHKARLTLLHVLPPTARSFLAPGVPREVLGWARRLERARRLRELAALVPHESAPEVEPLVVMGEASTTVVATAH